MINLMYLVLTALLALNVSNEILNAFKVLAKGIGDSNEAINFKTTEAYNNIVANSKDKTQADKVMPFRLKADDVVKRSDDMIAYLENWKKRIIAEAGGYNDDSTIKAEGNIDATTDLLVEKKGGDTVKSKIMALRQFLLQSVTEKDAKELEPLMPLNVTKPPKSDHNPTGDWNIGYFEHMPTVAAIAMFSKFQNDVRSSESQVITKLSEEAHVTEIKFDTVAAVAVPTTSYALVGQKIEASILLAAFNKSTKPTVILQGGGGSVKPAVNGVVPWETVASGTGLQTVKGVVELATEGGGKQSKAFSFSYMVGSTGASMQLDKMNVFYIGVDNPITVAAAGYSIEDVSVEPEVATGVTTKEDAAAGKGHYNITVEKEGPLQMNIKAKTQDGTKKIVGGLKVRVKSIPNPIASLADKYGGPMSASLFRVQIAPAAKLLNFDFDTRFLVVGFSFSMQPKGRDYQGPFTVYNPSGARFTDKDDIKKAMASAKIGDKVFIEDIKVIGPDHKVRTLPGSLTFTLN